tara:strand:- start:1650 stop:2585 length:936 start_codon:yes stop_codon:yes gene_type:complete
MKKIIFSNISYILFIFFLFTNNSISEKKIIIELKIGNEILTNIDIEKEQDYLVALNTSLKDVPKNQLKEIARNSIIKEIIKKNELSRYYDLKKTDEYTDKIFQDFISTLNFKNENEFKLYLENYDLSILYIKEKLKIESLWNELIFKKFSGQVNINDKEIKKDLSAQKKFVVEYNLSEILFQLDGSEILDEKYNLILKSINESGFKNSATFFSISDSSKFGGQIGWINETQLNKIMLKEVKNLKVNQITKPIQASSGYLILKLNDKKNKEVKIDIKKTINRRIAQERNRQLNQFSLIYFNKIKQNIFISEK